MQVPKTFKGDIIKFEFLLTNIKIPENRHRTPPPPRGKYYSPDNFSGSRHAYSIYKWCDVWVRTKKRAIALVGFFFL